MRIGTAYPIARDRVFTARHVGGDCNWCDAWVFWPTLCPEGRLHKNPELALRQFGNWCAGAGSAAGSGEPPSCFCGRVRAMRYDGGGQYDIVVLECPTPPTCSPTPYILTQSMPAAGGVWFSHGYPDLGKRTDGNSGPTWRERIDMHGTVSAPDNARLGLAVASDAKEKAGWCGLSGAPVFCGAWLYGMVVTSDPSRDNQLTALFLPHLLRGEENFRNAVAYPEPHVHFRAAIDYLNAVPALRSALSAELPSDLKEETSAIIDYLVRLPINELLNLLLRTKKQETAVSAAVNHLTSLLLPTFYGIEAAKVYAGRQDANMPIIALPYATAVSAELLMAAADRRAYQLALLAIDSNDAAVPQSSVCLPWLAESGRSGGAIDQAALEDDLAAGLALDSESALIDETVQKYDEHLAERCTWLRVAQHSFSREDKRNTVKNWLAQRQEEGSPGYYWLLSADDVDTRVRALADYLKIHYSQIAVLSLASDAERFIQENKQLSLLPKFLK